VEQRFPNRVREFDLAGGILCREAESQRTGRNAAVFAAGARSNGSSKSLAAPAAAVTRARVVTHAGVELCRLDVARSSRPVWAKTSKADRLFFVRMNNSSRPMPPDELDAYLADRWPDASTAAPV
jgi:hypothetical protein